jgi:hypothetical protein
MKKIIVPLLLAGFVGIILSACGGGGGGGRTYYRGHYGYGAWGGYPGYVDRRPIVVAPPGGGGDLEAVPLPEPPPDMPMPEAMPMEMDMGMPEIDIGL